MQDQQPAFSTEDADVTARFVPVQPFSRWTFDCGPIREWVEHHLDGRVLNACAGENELTHDQEVMRNDAHPKRLADFHVDVAELAALFPRGSFDTIVYDPPWSIYQSNLRYDGHHVQKTDTDIETRIDIEELPMNLPGSDEKSQIGHSRLAKDGFDYLLGDSGRVIELTFHGSCMPARLGYKRQERVLFDPYGEAKAVIGSVDQKE
jgi:hypothetical protein